MNAVNILFYTQTHTHVINMRKTHHLEDATVDEEEKALMFALVYHIFNLV